MIQTLSSFVISLRVYCSRIECHSRAYVRSPCFPSCFCIIFFLCSILESRKAVYCCFCITFLCIVNFIQESILSLSSCAVYWIRRYEFIVVFVSVSSSAVHLIQQHYIVYRGSSLTFFVCGILI